MTRRAAWGSAGTLVAAVLSVGLVAAPASAAAAPTSTTATPVVQTAPDVHLLVVAPNLGGEQGLAMCGSTVYVGYAVSGGGVIWGESQGVLTLRTGTLPTGHTAELACGSGVLWVANGGLDGTPVDVYEVNEVTGALERTLDFSSVGQDGMVATDPSNGDLVVFSGRPGGPWKITEATSAGAVVRSVALPDVGTPQGLEVVGGEVYELASAETGTSFTGNAITEFDWTGTTLRTVTLPTVTAETEGLGYDTTTGGFVVGTTTHQVYELGPLPAQPAGKRQHRRRGRSHGRS